MCFNVLTCQYEQDISFHAYPNIIVLFDGGKRYSWGLQDNSLATPVSLLPLGPYFFSVVLLTIFVVSPFPLEIFAPNTYFLILEYVIEVSSSHSKRSCDILSTLLWILILLTCRWKSSTKLIFAGAVVQLHLTCKDHCFAWFSSAKFISSKNMIISLYGIEEPSKMCPDLNEWRLSSLGWGTPLGLGRHGFESCWSLNFCSGFSVFAIAWNTGQRRGSLSNLFYFILFP